MKSTDWNRSDDRFYVEDVRVLNAISVELYLSLLTVVYSVLQGTIFQKPISDYERLVNQHLYNKIRNVICDYWAHAVATFLVLIYGMALQIVLSPTYALHLITVLHHRYIHTMYYYRIPGHIRYWTISIHTFKSHVLVALCSLVPFIIGFNASWRFYWELKNELRKSDPEYLLADES
uniref:TLC domain-containing protein n=1 Tax=Loa loa TaxID=7209 RepID=A0A1I7VSF3_LOALO